MAGAVVERLFPPKTTQEVEQIAASLNLLNAIVKLQEGRLLTSYQYIKGMTACLFTWLLYHPVDDVKLYWDKVEDVTYISVGRRQYSFHHVPLMRYYIEQCKGQGLTRQVWDGLQLQKVAASLFLKAVGKALPKVDDEEAKMLIHKMHHCSTRKIIRRINSLEGVPPVIIEEKPLATMPENETKKKRQRLTLMRRLKRWGIFVNRSLPNPQHPRNNYGEWKDKAGNWIGTPDEHLFNLTLALKWNGWWEENITLARMGDWHHYNIVTYSGTNYNHLVHTLMGQRPLRYIRPEIKMRKGWHYFLRRNNWRWAHVTYTRYLLLVAHYNYLKTGGTYYSLCITYRLARYLATAYPELRFVNVLNFTRFKVRRRVYSAQDLQRIGLQSKARSLKVWMVIDPLLLLADLDIAELPKELVKEYRDTEDYYAFFEIEKKKGKKGLVAYSRFHLLPTVYDDIRIFGHYAHVKNSDGQWAVYSLMQEEFITDFVFTKIYFDDQLSIVVGCQGDSRLILHDMFNPV